jgi:hypothetical protein
LGRGREKRKGKMKDGHFLSACKTLCARVLHISCHLAPEVAPPTPVHDIIPVLQMRKLAQSHIEYVIGSECKMRVYLISKPILKIDETVEHI